MWCIICLHKKYFTNTQKSKSEQRFGLPNDASQGVVSKFGSIFHQTAKRVTILD